MGEETQYQTIAFIFRPHGAGRFGEAVSLLLWLCIWAGGEAFALLILGQGLWALLTGRPFFGTDIPLRIGPALGVGLFLLFWLAFWTLGGLIAIDRLFRLVWAEDRLVLDRDVLWYMRRRGPFKSTRALARNDIRGVFVQRGQKALVVQLISNLVELTDLGTPAERAEAAQRLCAAMGFPNQGLSAEPVALPKNWQEASGTRGERLLVPKLKTRRQEASVVAIITGVVWTVLILLGLEGWSDPNLWAITLSLFVVGAWLASKTLWMLRGRIEWRIEPGKLVHQRRFGDKVTELCQARALELTESRDSDDDRWYHLYAVGLSPSPLTGTPKAPSRIEIARSMRDPTELRCLGQWMSQQASIPFRDLVPYQCLMADH